MPLLASNFTSNSLSGTVRVSGGAANISFGVAPFALEGNKTFVVKLRRGSVVGDVIATSNPITINDFSEIISLTANISTVAEGNIVSVSLVTANVPNNANIFYSVLPVTANVTASDFLGANAGMATIINNQATFALYANTDAGYVDETGETFKVQLRTNSTSGNIVYTTANVVVTDFYKLYNAIAFTESSAAVVEGGALTFTFTGHNIPLGTTLYYSTEGNVTSGSFTTGNTGSFVMNSLSNTITLTTTPTVFSGETRNFSLKIRSSDITGPVVATSNAITVVDTSLGLVTATGGIVTDVGGYRIHKFTSSGNLIITGTSATTNMEYLVIAGGGGGGGGNPYGYSSAGGGGGAGGVLIGTLPAANAGNITVVIGGGGGGGPGYPPYYGSAGSQGGNTVLNLNLVAVGGGGGGTSQSIGGTGGSGGGSGIAGSTFGANVIGQGNPGGTGTDYGGRGGAGGGGGYGSRGGSGFNWPTSQDNLGYAGRGGIGLLSSISGANVEYAGGGGGAGAASFTANVGVYGGGNGGSPATSGNVNTGGGGGGGAGATVNDGASGGSGIVIIRYPYAPVVFNSLTTTALPTVVEGDNITFTVNITNGNGYTYYYKTVGNVTTSDFVGGNTGSFTANATGGLITLQTASTIPTNETRYFALQITEDSLTGLVKATSANVTVADSTTYYIAADGGNVTYANGYKIHTFTTSSNLSVYSTSHTQTVQVLVVGGGGGAGSGDGIGRPGAGGGGGGFISTTASFTMGNSLVVIGAGGGGGAGGAQGSGGNPGAQGANTILGNLVAVGGGFGGGGRSGTPRVGGAGGSGGGGQNSTKGAGYGYPSPTQQGYPGGDGTGDIGVGGGGGASQAGTLSKGGDGAPFIALSNVIYGGGGGPGSFSNSGGAGGGGAGAGPSPGGNSGSAGTDGLGGGGGGGNAANLPNNAGGPGGAGGSGVVIVKYAYPSDHIQATGGNISILNGYKTHVFTSSATFAVQGLAASSPKNTIEYMVVGGGGGGGAMRSGFFAQGGGGGGGFVRGNVALLSNTTLFTITVGGGGAGAIRDPASPTFYGVNTAALSGSNSTFANTNANVSVTARGGGAHNTPGGSGGANNASGFGYPSPTQQGYPGSTYTGGGAGGAASTTSGGIGRNFDTPTFWGDPGPGPGRYFAGGGGGTSTTPSQAPIPGGIGGGGMAIVNTVGTAGNAFTGGGGAGNWDGPGNGSAGGSGIVVIRYPYP